MRLYDTTAQTLTEHQEHKSPFSWNIEQMPTVEQPRVYVSITVKLEYKTNVSSCFHWWPEAVGGAVFKCLRKTHKCNLENPLHKHLFSIFRFYLFQWIGELICASGTSLQQNYFQTTCIFVNFHARRVQEIGPGLKNTRPLLFVETSHPTWDTTNCFTMSVFFPFCCSSMTGFL